MVGTIRALGYVATARLVLLEVFSISKIVKVRIGNCDIYLRSSTPDIHVAADCFGGEFESIRGVLAEDFDGLLIDAGAYIGTAAIQFSSMFPRAKIISIEPSSENFELLEMNTRNVSNIEAIQAALVPISCEDRVLSDRGSGQWGYTIVEHPLDVVDPIHIERVRTVTLEHIQRTYPSCEIGLLKLDIEGGEKEIFDNEDVVLRDIRVVLVELHDRIAAGCTKAFLSYSAERRIVEICGEKYLSIRIDSPNVSER